MKSLTIDASRIDAGVSSRIEKHLEIERRNSEELYFDALMEYTLKLAVVTDDDLYKVRAYYF